MMTDRGVKFVFVLGALAAGGFLALVLMLGIFWETTVSLSWIIGFDLLCIAQILLLGHLVSRLEGAPRRSGPNWLYTAGFLHTLIALGVTIAFTAQQLGSSEDVTSVLRMSLAPMGAAILPHFVGVLIGQLLENPASSSGTRESSFLQQLSADASAARESLMNLYSERERVLVREIEALKEQAGQWSVLRSEVNGILEQIGMAATDNRQALKDLAAATRDALGTVEKSMPMVTKHFANTAVAADRMSSAAHKAAANVEVTSVKFREATATVEDLSKLHVAIVDLLSHELFRR
jgi:hypothetical protein